MIRKLLILSLCSAFSLAPLPAAADKGDWRGWYNEALSKLRKWMDHHDWKSDKPRGGLGSCR